MFCVISRPVIGQLLLILASHWLIQKLQHSYLQDPGETPELCVAANESFVVIHSPDEGPGPVMQPGQEPQVSVSFHWFVILKMEMEFQEWKEKIKLGLETIINCKQYKDWI